MFKTHRTYELTTGVKNNTIAVVAKSNLIEVLYHETIVVTAVRKKSKDGFKWEVALSNGGWDTVSTKAVINRALEQIPGYEGYYLSRIKGVTMLNNSNTKVKFESDKYL